MKRERNSGFSFIEIMVVVTVIGILAMLGTPGIRKANERTAATATANDVRVFIDAIEFYSTVEGAYPNFMTYLNMPESIEEYLPPVWKNGTHKWSYGNFASLTYAYLYGLDFNTEQSVRLDEILDDGNIATGKIRIGSRGTSMIYLFRFASAF